MIINLTQHLATDEQKEVGVVNLPEDYRQDLQELLTFNSLPTRAEIDKRACKIEDLVFAYLGVSLPEDESYEEARSLNVAVMIGGAPFLMPSLQNYFGYWCKVLYAFSMRESIDEVQEDGSVKKTAVFKHKGFVEA